MHRYKFSLTCIPHPPTCSFDFEHFVRSSSSSSRTLGWARWPHSRTRTGQKRQGGGRRSTVVVKKWCVQEVDNSPSLKVGSFTQSELLRYVHSNTVIDFVNGDLLLLVLLFHMFSTVLLDYSPIFIHYVYVVVFVLLRQVKLPSACFNAVCTVPIILYR